MELEEGCADEDLNSLRAQLKAELEYKIRVIKYFLQLKRTKGKLEKNIKALKGALGFLGGLNSCGVVELVEVGQKTQGVMEETTEIEAEAERKYLEQESVWIERIRHLECSVKVEQSRIAQQECELKAQISNRSRILKALIEEHSREVSVKSALLKEIQDLSKALPQLQEALATLKGSYNPKILEAHHRLSKEQDSALDIIKEINSLES